MDWDFIKNILLNTWTLSILTGIISSVIAHFCISLYSRKKANKVLQQKITSANNEILYALRPLVVDKEKPQLGLIRTLTKSMARKYAIEVEDLYSPEIIVEELTKEILENMFLSTKDKLLLCKDLGGEVVRNDVPKYTNLDDGDPDKNTYKIMYLSMSILLITMLTYMLAFTKDNIFTNIAFDNILIFILVIDLIVLLIIIFIRYYKHKKVFYITKIGDDMEKVKSPNENARIAKRLDEMDVVNAWKVYMEMGIHYANQQKNLLSAQYYEKAINVFPLNNKDNNIIGKLYILRGGILKRLGADFFDEALLSLQKGLEFVDDEHLKGDAYYNLACIYAKQDNRQMFDDVISNKLASLDENEEKEILARLDRWLKINASNYA